MDAFGNLVPMPTLGNIDRIDFEQARRDPEAILAAVLADLEASILNQQPDKQTQGKLRLCGFTRHYKAL
jgi:hypothetical protein